MKKSSFINLVFVFIMLVSISLEAFAQTQFANSVYGDVGFDQFGYDVAYSENGSIMAVGATSHDGGKGHVKIFKYNNGSWTQLGSDIDGEAGTDNSGHSLALSADGNIVAIGAPNNDGTASGAGHVRVYQYLTSGWTQLGSDIDGEAGDDQSGISVSLSSDGTILAVGAQGNDGTGASAGHVRVYKYSSSSWSQLGSDIDGEAAGDQSGWSVSLSSDGTIVAIGAPSNHPSSLKKGHVRVYQYASSTWTQLGSDIDGEDEFDDFGHSVELSSDGTIVAIGAPFNDGTGSNAGHVRVYQYSSGSWSQLGSDIDGEAAGDESGWAVSISSDGTIVAIGGWKNTSQKGHVRVYKYASSSWSQVGNDIDGTSTDLWLGISVSLNGTGSKVAATGHWSSSPSVNYAGVSKVYTITEECADFYDLPTTASTTYTGDYSTTDDNGWRHFCSSDDELLLSLKIGSSGAVIADSEVKLKLGAAKNYSYIGSDAGLISTGNKGYQMIDRRWDVDATTQPSSGNVGVRYYFTNAEYNNVKDSLLLHGPSQDASLKSTLDTVTEMEMYKATSGSAFADPHTVSGVVISNGSTASTTVWVHSNHNSGADHVAEFEVASFSGGGGGGGGGGGSGAGSLPVELIDFTVTKTSLNEIDINWATASELNNDVFIIERSADGQTFSEIHSVRGAGTTQEIQLYNFVDTEVANERIVYYRLVQVDFDGTRTLSKTTKVILDNDKQLANHKISVCPNPAKTITNVVIQSQYAADFIKIKVGNLAGETVYQQDFLSTGGYQILPLNLSVLTSGVYVATIDLGGNINHVKLIKN